MDSTYLAARIAKTKVLIDAYETAVDALVVGQVQEYQLDTGQDKTVVKRIDVPKLNEQLDVLYNRLCGFENRLNGGNNVTVRPA